MSEFRLQDQITKYRIWHWWAMINGRGATQDDIKNALTTIFNTKKTRPVFIKAVKLMKQKKCLTQTDGRLHLTDLGVSVCSKTIGRTVGKFAEDEPIYQSGFVFIKDVECYYVPAEKKPRLMTIYAKNLDGETTTCRDQALMTTDWRQAKDWSKKLGFSKVEFKYPMDRHPEASYQLSGKQLGSLFG